MSFKNIVEWRTGGTEGIEEKVRSPASEEDRFWYTLYKPVELPLQGEGFLSASHTLTRQSNVEQFQKTRWFGAMMLQVWRT